MILVTGGLGYLGSHIALYLMSKGHEVVLVDNLSHASMETLERLEYITKLYIPFIRLDVRNTPAFQKVFEQYSIDYVIHCAGFKSISESINKPLEYYNNNISCTMSLLRAMQRSGIRRLVNLSSIAVYGKSGLDWTETDQFDFHQKNPYVRAQQSIEQIMEDTFSVDSYWQIINLRLGNVIGTYTDQQLGEWSSPIPKSVIQYLLQVAAKQRDSFEICHQDHQTADGTSERGYIHIMDVLDVIYRLMIWSNNKENFFETFNITAHQATSLKQLIEFTEKVTNTTIPITKMYEVSPEMAQLDADNSKVKNELDWSPEFSIEDMIRDQWKYHQKVLAK